MGSYEPTRAAGSRRPGRLVLPVVEACCAWLCAHAGAAGNSVMQVPDASSATPAQDSLGPLPVALDPLFADLQERTLRFFWETGNPRNGPIPERYPTPSLAGIAAVGFGLTGNSATPMPEAIGVLRDPPPVSSPAPAPDSTGVLRDWRAAALDPAHPAALDPFFADLEQRTFRFFWETGNPKNGLIPDRYPTPSFASIAAVGFGLTSYPIGVERGYILREAARARVLATLRFFVAADNQHGFFYNFIDMRSGARAHESEVSTVDTALLLAGVLFVQSYFDSQDPQDMEIRALAEEISGGVACTGARPRPPAVALAWTPEAGFASLDWNGYNEAMLVYLLALGSPTHPVREQAWTPWTSRYDQYWGTLYDQTYLSFAPLFGHQYTHVWVDFRGIQDGYMRDHGLDYFENSRR